MVKCECCEKMFPEKKTEKLKIETTKKFVYNPIVCNNCAENCFIIIKLDHNTEEGFQLTEQEEEVYKILKRNLLPMKRKEIDKHVKYSPQHVYAILSRLEKKRLIKITKQRIGVGKPITLYQIHEEGIKNNVN